MRYQVDISERVRREAEALAPGIGIDELAKYAIKTELARRRHQREPTELINYWRKSSRHEYTARLEAAYEEPASELQ